MSNIYLTASTRTLGWRLEIKGKVDSAKIRTFFRLTRYMLYRILFHSKRFATFAFESSDLNDRGSPMKSSFVQLPASKICGKCDFEQVIIFYNNLRSANFVILYNNLRKSPAVPIWKFIFSSGDLFQQRGFSLIPNGFYYFRYTLPWYLKYFGCFHCS